MGQSWWVTEELGVDYKDDKQAQTDRWASEAEEMESKEMAEVQSLHPGIQRQFAGKDGFAVPAFYFHLRPLRSSSSIS